MYVCIYVHVFIYTYLHTYVHEYGSVDSIVASLLLLCGARACCRFIMACPNGSDVPRDDALGQLAAGVYVCMCVCMYVCMYVYVHTVHVYNLY